VITPWKPQIIILEVRGFLRVLSTALLLLTVALVSAMVTMRLAVHGREVKVPDLRGKSPSEARRVAESLSLATQIDRQYYSAAVPEGKVLSQTPAPGTVVRHGWELRLAVSLGPQRVAIPQVVGESQRAAGIILQQRGLDNSISEIATSSAGNGQVLAQDPPANAVDVAAPKVNLLIAKTVPAAYLVPSFIGRPLGSVTLAIKDAGFVLGKITVASGTDAANPQTAVSNANSAEVIQGAAPAEPVNVVPSPPPNPSATVPSASPAGTPSPASIVVAQQPAAGQKILAGAEIRLIVK
jgi:eukaryotic-like serine/threonine-protein kinase